MPRSRRLRAGCDQRLALAQLCDLRPCPENDEVYGAQSLNDPDILEPHCLDRGAGRCH